MKSTSQIWTLLACLSFASACGSEHKKSKDAAPQLSLKDIPGGETVREYQGEWASSCIVENSQSRALKYTFSKAAFIIDEAIDPLYSQCETDALHVQYRFRISLQDYLKDKLFTRQATLDPVQVIATSSSEQLTKQFNDATQCGFSDWKTGQGKDITGTICLGTSKDSQFALPLANIAGISRIELKMVDNDLYISATPGSRLSKIIMDTNKLVASDSQEAGLKFWNNEKPDLGRTELTTTVAVPGLNLAGTGRFNNIVDSSPLAPNEVVVKAGVMTFRTSVYNGSPALEIPLKYGYIWDVTKQRTINFSYDDSIGTYNFYYYENNNRVPLATIPAPQAALAWTPWQFHDQEAPQLKEIKLESAVRIGKVIELTFKAQDDYAGTDGASLIIPAKSIQTGSLTTIRIQSSSMTYLGAGTYKTTFLIDKHYSLNYTDIKIESVVIRDRSGRSSEPVNFPDSVPAQP